MSNTSKALSLEAARQESLAADLHHSSNTKVPAETKAPAEAADKRAAFLRVGGKRMGKALKAISLLGNLANRSSYDYTEDDLIKMQQALNDAIKGVLSRMNAVGKKSEGGGFQF